MQVPVLIIVLDIIAEYLSPIVRSILGIHVPYPNILGKLLFLQIRYNQFYKRVFLSLGQNGVVEMRIRNSTLDSKITCQDPGVRPLLHQFGTVTLTVPYDALTPRHGAFNRYGTYLPCRN